ncbi:MAG: hypothetical protein WC489_09120 [Patescibacteria group bacterium]
MRYYLAAPFGADRRDAYLAAGLDLLYSPTYGKVPRPCEDGRFALDNGAFSAYVNRAIWDEARFYRLVRQIVDLGIAPTFVVLPDIVAGGLQSLVRSMEHVGKLPDDWRKYLPVQDGMSVYDLIPAVITRIDGVFVGGSTVWKWRTAKDWCEFAHLVGLDCHIGRVNSERQILAARHAGADSVDGSTASRHHSVDRLLRYRALLQEQAVVA